MRAFIDSDILIWHLRGNRKAHVFLTQLAASQEYELWIGAMQRAEVVFFMRAGEEALTHKFLSIFKTATVDQHVVDAAGTLFRKWHPSHGLDVNDAILAALAQQVRGKIFTLNVKHFPMPGLLVGKAW